MLPTPALALVGISKSFPGVLALSDVSFEIAAGSVHALCGENGAGKSTLGRILAGIHSPDSGDLLVFGERVRFASPREALDQGIGMVHQELSFCENLSVAENLCLGALPSRRGFLDHDGMNRRAARILEAIEAPIPVGAKVGDLSLGQRQLVQVAAAVGAGARVIVFDEPTSSLSQREAERLYHLIEKLRAQGVTSIYVSHRMNELFALCDTVTVLRDGRHVATQPLAASDEAGLVRMMIGRAIDTFEAAPLEAGTGAEVLRVTRLCSPGKFHDVSFSLHAGDILGFAGLVGAGRSEIAHALFGLDPNATGEIHIRGQRVAIRSPRQAMQRGIGLVPEDRKRQGLIPDMSALSNTTLPVLDRLATLAFIKEKEERDLGATYFERLRVRAPSFETPIAVLSGGNQQKLVLAKWLAAKAEILILDEPTRGVDVGAKAEIHALIDTLARAGHAILLISSELPELLKLSSRIVVVREGRAAGELSRQAANQNALLRLMAGLAV